MQDSIKTVEEQQSTTQGEVACLGKRLSSLEDQELSKRTRLDKQDERFDKQDERLDQQDGRLDKVEKENGVLVTQVQGLQKEVTGGNKIKLFPSLTLSRPGGGGGYYCAHSDFEPKYNFFNI